MADIYKMTQKGLDEKKKELNYRENEKRNEISEQIKYAKSLGDFSENAELDAAKEADNQNEKEILRLKHEIEYAVVIKATIYKIHDIQDKADYTYTIVGDTEASIEKDLISMESPLGRALAGHKVGDTVEVRLSATDGYKVKILDIDEE